MTTNVSILEGDTLVRGIKKDEMPNVKRRSSHQACHLPFSSDIIVVMQVCTLRTLIDTKREGFDEEKREEVSS